MVSVLMTVYNREKYIATAIESVLSQTFTDFELIIVDDGSSDRSLDIAQSYFVDPRVRVYRNEQNLGDYPNRNRAASLAIGKYLKYVDSDDAILPHCLEIMFHMMERYPNAGLLLWSTEGDAFYPFELPPVEVYRQTLFHAKRFERAPLSMLIRKDIFTKLGGFDIQWPLCADSEFCQRVARYHPLLYGPHGLVYYRIHEGQVFSSTTNGYIRRSLEAFGILMFSLRHPDCPLPPPERAWHQVRLLYGAFRYGYDLALRQGRWLTAWKFLWAIGIKPTELLPALVGKPDPPPPPRLPEAPDWRDFPPCHRLTNAQTKPSCMVSIIVAPEQDDSRIRLCLESLRHQRLTELDVLVTVDERQKNIREQVFALNDRRFHCVDVPCEAGTWERFNLAAQVAAGAYCKFIGPELPLLYPYAMEIEVSVLENRPGRDFISAGSAGFILGGLDLTPEEALTLDAGTEGKYLRVDPACALIRRTALGDTPIDPSLGQWALVDLLYRLAARSGAILGPYGLSTAWRRYEPWPMGELPEILKERTLALYRELNNVQPVADWTALVAEGRTLDAGMPSRCQWDSPSWILPDTTTSRREKKPCP
jgi:glycosyltransferase involved in cell wall biosynthesis